jgi:hypothetical protein
MFLITASNMLQSGSTIVSVGVSDIPGGTEHIWTKPHREGASGADSGSIPPNDVDMADDTGLVPVQQAGPGAVLVSLISDEMHGRDVLCDAASADCDMLGDASENRHAADANTGNEILAQDLADGRSTEGFDSGQIVSTPRPGLVPSPLSIPITTPSGVDTGHDLQTSFVGQSGRTVDAGIKPADISGGVHHEPQNRIVTDPPSIDSASYLLNNSRESPKAVNMAPINKPDVALMPMPDSESSSQAPNTITTKQNSQTSEVQRAPGELPSTGSSLSPQTVPGMHLYLPDQSSFMWRRCLRGSNAHSCYLQRLIKQQQNNPAF